MENYGQPKQSGDNNSSSNEINIFKRRNTESTIPNLQFLSSSLGNKKLNSKRHSIMSFNNFLEIQAPKQNIETLQQPYLEQMKQQNKFLVDQQKKLVSQDEQKKIKEENQMQIMRDYQNFMRQFEKKKKQEKIQQEDVVIFWEQKIYPVQKYDFQVYYDEKGNRKWNFHEVTEKEMKKQEQDEEIQKQKEKQEFLKKLEFKESEQSQQLTQEHQKVMQEIEDQWKRTQRQKIQFINNHQKKNFSVVEQQNQEIKKSQSQDAFQSKKIMQRDQYTIRKVLSSVPLDKLKWIMDEKKKNFNEIQQKLLKNPIYKLKPQVKPTLSFYSKTSAQFNEKNLSGLMQQQNGSQQLTQNMDNSYPSFRQTTSSCFERLYTQKTASFLNKKFNINNPDTQSFLTTKNMWDTNGFRSSFSTAIQTPSSSQDPYQFEQFKIDTIIDQDDLAPKPKYLQKKHVKKQNLSSKSASTVKNIIQQNIQPNQIEQAQLKNNKDQLALLNNKLQEKLNQQKAFKSISSYENRSQTSSKQYRLKENDEIGQIIFKKQQKRQKSEDFQGQVKESLLLQNKDFYKPQQILETLFSDYDQDNKQSYVVIKKQLNTKNENNIFNFKSYFSNRYQQQPPSLLMTKQEIKKVSEQFTQSLQQQIKQINDEKSNFDALQIK
ncbi:hypothetical protein TTHERM_00726420 (macronuclear) [Tetrahymena thermophila SB210]|uniref:Uncharacterized protein n=1 Tax=Tetrahymena thermophila (strain SB210) TaxID=312017 RepID=Q24GE9_TETTS|nr:hypothetical protein TTHERM_00726420 [Tetrahymena thermophila SB210]EAS06922.2 hypothetical protein TTHERM_00726420 [Tetrahymena thermophila SB210]|eukprot:XP_001027164.2 hypothetical protein TTHERM_00726420 [Tetrahymena thermophila SB210]